MPDFTEQPLPAEALTNIKGCAAQAIEILDLTDAQAADPAAVVAAVDRFVYDWRRGRRPEAGLFDEADAPFIFGSLWGEAMVARFGWAWVAVTFHFHAEGQTETLDTVAPGVVAPDRSLVVYPIDFLLECFEDASIDATVQLAYAALDGGGIAGALPGAYQNVMDGVHRAVPRP